LLALTWHLPLNAHAYRLYVVKELAFQRRCFFSEDRDYDLIFKTLSSRRTFLQPVERIALRSLGLCGC
jgi:hypothetical protein